MKIVHYKKTNIASAPDALSNAMNKFSDHESVVVKGVRKAKNVKADVVHYHNTTTPIKAPKSVMQYHSEPHRANLGNIGVDQKLVIAQYHATLPEYEDCRPVRNIIDFTQPKYKPKRIDDKIRVAFSPSVKTNNGYWYNKAYRQTRRVLERLKEEFPLDFDYDIITRAPLDQCIERKRNANVIIDECVTPSYHRSGLEGLALGKLTLCSLNKEVEDVLAEASGTVVNPFHNVEVIHLYHELKQLIERGTDYVLDEGKKSRQWMEDHWHPQDVVNEFLEIYKML